MRISNRYIRKCCVTLLALYLAFNVLEQTIKVTLTIKVLTDNKENPKNHNDTNRKAPPEMDSLFPVNISTALSQKNESLKKFQNITQSLQYEDYIRSISTNKSFELNDYFKNGLVVDWWDDICLQNHLSDLNWHPLFPKLPKFTTFSLNDPNPSQHNDKFLQRIHGYLYTEINGFYDLAFWTKAQGSFIMVDSNVTVFSYKRNSYSEDGPKISYLKISELKKKQKILNRLESIWMTAYRLYFIELVQSSRRNFNFQLLWREAGQGEYKEIPEQFLLYDNKFVHRKGSAFFKIGKPNLRLPVTNDEKTRNDFHKISVLQSDHLFRKFPLLTTKKYKGPKKVEKLYDGFHKHLDWSVTYPKELFDYSRTHFTPFTPDERLVLQQNEASNVARKTFNLLNELHENSLEFVRIVHIRRNTNKTEHFIKLAEQSLTMDRMWYFVEIDVRKNKQLFRASHYMKLDTDGDLRFISNYRWQEKIKINIVTPIKNQIIWLKFMISMLEEIQEKTNEKNIELIVVDSGSTDGDYKSILAESKLPHKYLNYQQSRFSKVKALNYGLKNIENKNSIAFILDLHLQLPSIIFDRIRKMTIKGISAFTPTLMQLACGEHEEYTDMKNSIWLDTGTGMLAMYMQDWYNIHGYNETMFKDKWGGEDWEILDRIAIKGYTIHHFRMARFYHLFHPRKGDWYG